jgi:uncharacterized phage protein gp47/JayE
MASPFDKDFDEILQEILVDYSNLDSNPDTSQGSMPFIMGSVLASMVWGLYRYQDWINLQHFPDTASTDNLNHWGSVYDITRLDTDTDATYLTKILNFLRQPPAGGNALDFENWALDSDEVYVEDGDDTYYNAYVTVVDVAFGPGTVGLYTIPNDETIIDVVGPPNNEELLRVATETYIESVRPLGMLSATITSAKRIVTAITIDLTAPAGVTLDEDAIEAAIEAELDTYKPGQVLYHSTLECICVAFGAADAVTIAPIANPVTPSDAQFIRAGAITFI